GLDGYPELAACAYGQAQIAQVSVAEARDCCQVDALTIEHVGIFRKPQAAQPLSDGAHWRSPDDGVPPSTDHTPSPRRSGKCQCVEPEWTSISRSGTSAMRTPQGNRICKSCPRASCGRSRISPAQAAGQVASSDPSETEPGSSLPTAQNSFPMGAGPRA